MYAGEVTTLSFRTGRSLLREVAEATSSQYTDTREGGKRIKQTTSHSRKYAYEGSKHQGSTLYWANGHTNIMSYNAQPTASSSSMVINQTREVREAAQHHGLWLAAGIMHNAAGGDYAQEVRIEIDSLQLMSGGQNTPPAWIHLCVINFYECFACSRAISAFRK